MQENWDKNKTIMKKFNYSGSCKYMAYFIYFCTNIFGLKNYLKKIQKCSVIEEQQKLLFTISK